MKYRLGLLGILSVLLWSAPARADNRIIVRSTLDLQALQAACNLPLIPICTVVGGLGDPLGQLFVITSPLDLNGLLNLLGNPLGIVDAELDQVLNLIDLQSLLPTPLPAGLLSDRTLVPFPNSANVWNAYASQPASSIVRAQSAQTTFGVLGAGTVADIDTGVDPTHPALQSVLLTGYDFTRDESGASELRDLDPSFQPAPCSPATCPTPATVNQSSAAILDQSSAAILDTPAFAAFGHGTMVMGIIHLVAPSAKLLPLKAFKPDGTGDLSNILRAIYFAAANNADIINMSFDTKSPSLELTKALDYANQQGLISAASAGNDGQGPPLLVYPAALLTDVMGVASTGSTPLTQDTRSSFSNFGNGIVWVTAPGEAIVTTYPFSTYAAGWGTSFSAPFVSGASSLLLNKQATTNEALAAAAVAHAVSLGADLGHGRLDIVQALQFLSPADFSLSPDPAARTIDAGDTTTYALTITPISGFNQTVTLSCGVLPAGPACDINPPTVTLDGTHAQIATVTLSTTARTASTPVLLPRFASRPRSRGILPAFLFLWLIVLVTLLRWHRMLRRSRFGWAAHVACVLAVSLCAYSCGGSGGSPNGSGSGSGGGPGGGGNPSATLSSVAVNPASVQGGTPSTGTVTLSAAAPSGGAAVTLSSGNTAAATVPASLTVPAGATSATFPVSTTAVTSSTPVTLSASYSGTTKTTTLTVTPAPAAGTPAGIYQITLTGTAPNNFSHATTVQLTVR